MISFTFIETPEQLNEAVKLWKNEKQLAIDIECENNLHHYGAYISLIQVSDKENNWVIDVLKLKDITEFIKILQDPKIKKIFHDVNFDLRIIQHQFKAKTKNVFDTQLAAEFLGKEKIGLGSLLEEYFEIKKESKFQRVDWTRRPLSEEMLSYAANDTAYLLKLKDKLSNELKKLERFTWVEEECKNFETMDWSYHEQTYLDVTGVKHLSERERARFHVLFEARKKLAEEVDKPVFMIFRNKQLLAFAKNPPYSWKTLKGVHPLVREREDYLKKILREAKEEPVPEKVKGRLTTKQKVIIKEITENRNQLAEKLEVKAHLLLKENQIRNIVVNGSLDGLRDWQKKLVSKITNKILKK